MTSPMCLEFMGVKCRMVSRRASIFVANDLLAGRAAVMIRALRRKIHGGNPSCCMHLSAVTTTPCRGFRSPSGWQPSDAERWRLSRGIELSAEHVETLRVAEYFFRHDKPV